MSWIETKDGNWRFVRNADETWEESLKRCMSSETYTAGDDDWVALLIIATDIISGKLNPSGTPGLPGTSFQVDYPVNFEALPPDS